MPENDVVLDVVNGGGFVQRATDPVLPGVSTPADFAAQFPQPLDTTEILALCEEISVYQAIPQIRTPLNAHLWREMTSLAFVTGSNLIAFTDGACPETYSHDGENLTVTHKNIGAYKALSQRDIMHSMAVSAAGWNGINTLVGGWPGSQGQPGGADAATFAREQIAGVKEKEVRLASTLVLNGWDRLLVQGDATTRPLEFDGIENWAANRSCTFHTNTTSASGTFSAATFDNWLGEACAKPTHVFGHPAAIQEMLSGYFTLGFNGSQIVNFNDGNRIVPGYNFAGFVNTGIGRLTVVADTNFTKTAAGANLFMSKLYALRMTHNGEPLVYQSVQVPLAYQDLAPGCTAVAFEVWAALALVIKACCAQGAYTGFFTGRVAGISSCTKIG